MFNLISRIQQAPDSVNQVIENTSTPMSTGADSFVVIFLYFGAALFFVVLFVLPVMSLCIAKKREDSISLRGLGLPEGSVRSMLALLIVGTYMIVALLGATYKGKVELANLGEVLSALAGVAGAVIGFYFGTRGSDSK